jgi:superfamily II DNA or RNA helicase
MRLKFDGGTIVLENSEQQVRPIPFQFLQWDQRVNAYRGPAHLLPKIQTELKTLGFTVEPPRFNFHEPIVQKRELQLRPYQEAALSAWEIGDRKGTLILPTGSGKTHVAISAIRKLRKPTLILVPTRVLLHQCVGALEKYGGISAGTLGDGIRHLEPVTITTFESAYRNMSWLGDRFDFLVVDEVHHFGRGVRDEALEMSIASHRLGLTATAPQDEEWHGRINSLVGPVVFDLGLNDLRGSYLSDFEIIRIHVELTQLERAQYERDNEAFRSVNRTFKESFPDGSWKDFAFYASRSEAGRKALKSFQAAQKILSFPEGKGLALENIINRHGRDKILIFTPDTATAYAISKKHLIMPLTSDINRKERENALEWFKSSQISTLVSCQVLNEGFDVPEANVAIILGGRRGEREHLQRVGRILRWKEGQKARIYELVCNRTIELRQANRRGRQLDF